jgi:hypothetical protein
MSPETPQPTSEELYLEGEAHAPVDYAAETARSRKLADRYELEFVDLTQFRINNDLFRSIPADLMLRYGFVPYRREGQTLLIVVSDPSDLQAIDEIGLQLGMPVRVTVGAPSAIHGILKKSESSTRVLEEATEGFQMQILRDEEGGGDENLTVDKLTSDISPVIRLVDTMVFTALQRRASDSHIETQDDAVHVKYRIDGVLQQAMKPIDKRHHSTLISPLGIRGRRTTCHQRGPSAAHPRSLPPPPISAGGVGEWGEGDLPRRSLPDRGSPSPPLGGRIRRRSSPYDGGETGNLAPSPGGGMAPRLPARRSNSVGVPGTGCFLHNS